MAKYKITNIDEVKKHVTFEVYDDKDSKVYTDTRGDLPLHSKEEVHAALSDFAIAIVKDSKTTETDPEVTDMKGKMNTAETKEERDNSKPKEA